MPSYARQTLAVYDSAPDLIDQDTADTVWNQAQNVSFRNGETVRSNGQAPAMGATLFEPYALAFYQALNGTPYWLYAGPGGVGVTDGATHWDITPTVWAPAAVAIWQAFSWNGVVILHNSTGVPVYWAGDPLVICEPLPEWPVGWRFTSMRPHKSFLFAIGRLDAAGPQRVNWSDAAEAGTLPGSWEAAADNLAGFVDLATGDGGCLDAMDVRDSLFIFKGESVHQCDFIGGNEVFAFRKAFDFGILAPNAWAEGPNDQLLIATSNGDFEVFNGADHRSIAAGKCQRTYYDQLASNPFYLMSGATLGRELVSLIAFPRAGDTMATQALSYSWDDGATSFRDLLPCHVLAAGRYLSDVGALNEWDGDAAAWDTDQTPWNYEISAATNDDVIGGGPEGLLHFGPPALDVYAFKGGLSYGDAQRRKLCAFLWPRVVGQPGDVITFQVGGQETVDGPITWDAPQEWEVGSGLPVETFAEGRFLAIEIQSQDGAVWRMAGFDVEFRGLGQW